VTGRQERERGKIAAFAMSSTTSSTAASSAAPLKRRGAIALLVLFALIWFSNLDYRRLVHPDEGRYAEISREMALTGDWVTPRLNGIKYFEKPALQYWITAAAYDAFGVRHWTARLWPALTGFLGVLFIGYVGLRVGGPRQALYSAAALGGCVWHVVNAHFLTLDAGLTFWMSVGLGGLIIAQRADATAREQRGWMLVAWAALAFAVLSKGLIGVVLPGAALAIYSLVARDWALWRRLHLLAGTLVFLAIAAPWFVLVSWRNPEFFDFFFIHEHFTRFLTNEAKREGPWWYFIPFFAAGILPWLTLFAWTARRIWSDARVDRNGFCWPRFALVWSAFIFVFFSASASKLPSYILPLFPALALVLGWQLTVLSDSLLLRLSLLQVVPAGVAWLALLVGYDSIAAHFADARQPLGPLLAYGPWLKSACSVAFAGGLAGLWALHRGRRTMAVLVTAFTTLIAVQLIVTGHDELAESRSAAPLLSRVIARYGPVRADVPFYTVRTYDQTLPYYLGRTVTQVEHPDELAMGIASEPEKAIATVGQWRPTWDAADQAYAMMQPDEYENLLREGVPMRELGRDTRRVIVSRR
jgi:4-amino-4-deoxy-L-arabinose transferase-like glycosyltransferase